MHPQQTIWERLSDIDRSIKAFNEDIFLTQYDKECVLRSLTAERKELLDSLSHTKKYQG